MGLGYIYIYIKENKMRANNIAFNHNSRGWKDLFIIE